MEKEFMLLKMASTYGPPQNFEKIKTINETIYKN
jgi:hypothetical protein